MDNRSYADDVEIEEGLTFAKIAYFFKKGWLRMIVYAVIAALLTTAIALPIKLLYKSEPVAQTTIEFIYDGIENGQSPDGGMLDTGRIISPAVLSQAVNDAELGGTIKDISSLRELMRVESVEPEEYIKLVEAAANGDSAAANTLRTYVLHPTRFRVILSNPSKLDLSDAQATRLLNAVIQAYYNDFQRTYSVINLFPTETYKLSSNTELEFADIYDQYRSSLTSVRNYLSSLAAKKPDFVSHKENTTFSQLLGDLTLLENNYAVLNAYLVSNNVWRRSDTARASLVATRAETTIRVSALERYITDLKEQIASFKPNSTNTFDPSTHETISIYTSYPDSYYEYQDKLDEANRQKLEYGMQLANIEARLKQIEEGGEASDAHRTKAAADLVKLEANSASLVAKINAAVQDYYDTSFVTSSVRQIQPPIVTRRTADFNLLIVYAAAVIVALIAAGVVTALKIVNARRKDSSAAQQQDAPAEAPSERQ